MPTDKVTEISRINNTFFAEKGDKARVKIAGIIKEIEDKETPTGTAKRFKGDFAMVDGQDTYRAKYAFFPAAIRDALISALGKLKWDTAEFVFTAEKTQTDKVSTWTVTFSVNPRVEQPRVLAMLG